MTDVSSARVAAYLREAILGGVLKPGDRIRQEEVASQLGASRLPVREALRMLEAEGLTEHEAHKGARVPRLSAHEVDVIYRMREKLGQRPNVSTRDPDVRIVAHLARSQLSLSLDLCGDPLFQRGYRVKTTEAPLKETLAAAILREAGYTGEEPARAAETHGVRLEVVRLPGAKRGFVLLPRRWAVERSFAWPARFRRLARDYERLPTTLAGLHFVAFARLMPRRAFPVLTGSA